MTLGTMMKKAITFFEQEAKEHYKKSGEYPEIRNVFAQEMSIGQSRSTATFLMEYAIDGDYTESDKHPKYVYVKAHGNQLDAEWVTF